MFLRTASPVPSIAAVGTALPPHWYDQATILDGLKEVWAGKNFNAERLERLHRNVLVGGRHLALPIEEIRALRTWGEANDAWIRVAVELGEVAIGAALQASGTAVEDLGAIFFVSVTGIATPSIDARLVDRLGLPSDIKRTPIFGLGCVGGAAGLTRAADYVRAYPDKAAVLLAVELCSLTLQAGDLSIPNLIATGLFGDGAAAAVVRSGAAANSADLPERRTASSPPGPAIVATRSIFYPHTEHIMGWNISERGFGVVLSAELPDLVLQRLAGDVDNFLAEQDLKRHDIGAWVAHPGGPKVLEAVQQALDLPAAALRVTWEHMQQYGNLSSASVLFVLKEHLESQRPAPGTYGVLFAMGPGFCLELLLLQW